MKDFIINNVQKVATPIMLTTTTLHAYLILTEKISFNHKFYFFTASPLPDPTSVFIM
jgi:hypothetical protein